MTAYTDSYKESVFQFWYSAGCPQYTVLHTKIQPDEYGRIPHEDIIKIWASEGQWKARADELNGKAIIIAEENLVTQQVEMWKEHAERARQVSEKAFEKILVDGFDTSASAIQALKWAQEEERKTRGAEAFIAVVKDKSNDDLIKMVRDLATRQLSTEEEYVDATAENVEDSAESSN